MPRNRGSVHINDSAIADIHVTRHHPVNAINVEYADVFCPRAKPHARAFQASCQCGATAMGQLAGLGHPFAMRVCLFCHSTGGLQRAAPVFATRVIDLCQDRGIQKGSVDILGGERGIDPGNRLQSAPGLGGRSGSKRKSRCKKSGFQHDAPIS